MAAPTSPITYILPDEGWASLLEIIVHDAPAGAVIEVNTAGMQALAERMLQAVGRQDMTVALRPPRVGLSIIARDHSGVVGNTARSSAMLYHPLVSC